MNALMISGLKPKRVQVVIRELKLLVNVDVQPTNQTTNHSANQAADQANSAQPLIAINAAALLQFSAPLNTVNAPEQQSPTPRPSSPIELTERVDREVELQSQVDILVSRLLAAAKLSLEYRFNFV
jgi:hypothetical protein